jgi:hypothetical protein
MIHMLEDAVREAFLSSRFVVDLGIPCGYNPAIQRQAVSFASVGTDHPIGFSELIGHQPRPRSSNAVAISRQCQNDVCLLRDFSLEIKFECMTSVQT